MVAFFHDDCHDAFLNIIKNNGTNFTICNAQPTTYNQANQDSPTGYRLGYKSGLTSGSYTGPQDRGSPAGRELQINAITLGTVSVSGTASHWAIHDGSSRLLVTHTLNPSQSVTVGNTFSVSAYEVYVADPT